MTWYGVVKALLVAGAMCGLVYGLIALGDAADEMWGDE